MKKTCTRSHARRPRRGLRARLNRCRLLAPALAVSAVALLFVGCSSPTSYETTDNAGVATFTGDRYLRGTVGSYGSFVNNLPRYVGGYGMVVDLDGTGSNEVPGFMRDWIMNEMRRYNLGSFQFGTRRFTPERVMADTGSSVVAVEGLIPPGAKAGSKFDLLVTMVDQTSTSLAGGRLFWPTQLSATGLDRRMIYTKTVATGYGEMFVDPIKPIDESDTEFLRSAVVVNGGTVLVAQNVQFVLNQPSYRIASLIAERINARFESTDEDNLPTAVAKSDGLIDINVPARWSQQADEMLALIEHLYLDPTPQFVRPQAEALGKALVQQPVNRQKAVKLAWKMLGRNTIPVLRQYYTHSNASVRAAALEAGAWLQDNEAIDPLAEIATRGNPADRIRAARVLVVFTRSIKARRVVRDMLNAPDPAVRMGAYEALVMAGDDMVDRLSVHDGTAHKFYIDRVPSEYPAVYAVQGDELAIVIFGGDIPLRSNTFAKIDDTLSLQTLPVPSIPVGLMGRYAGETAYIPIHRCGALEMIPSLTPVSDDPDAKLPPPDWRVEVGDNDGNKMMVNIRETNLQDAFGVELLNVPGRDTPTEKPRALAMVRIVKEAGKDKDGKPTPPVGELLKLQDADASLPVIVRYRNPAGDKTRHYRITPTVATLAYTLGYKQDNINTKIGPDLSFSTVVQALYRLSVEDQYDAPFEAQLNPLAQQVSEAQRENKAEPRPVITPEELEILRGEEDEELEKPAPDGPESPESGTPAPVPPLGSDTAAGGSAKQ